MQRLFTAIYRYFEKHPRIYWLCFGLCFGLSILGALRANFEEDIQKAIPQDPQVAAMNDILSHTKAGSQLIFSLSFKDSNIVDPDSLMTLQQEFQAGIEQFGGNNIKDIRAHVDDSKQQQFIQLALDYLPLLLDSTDYQHIDHLLTPDTLLKTLQNERRLLLSPAGLVVGQWIARDPLGMTGLAMKKFQALQFDPSYELYDGYLFNEQERKLNFFISLKAPPTETGKNEPFFDKLNRFLIHWDAQHPQLQTLYFGAPAVATGNAVQMKKDTILTLSITLALLLLLTLYVFRKKRAPFLLMLPVVFGGLFGLALTMLLQGSISVIALGAGAIILGIAIDFSVHFMSHARQHPNMEDNVRTLVFPLTLGAFTTIAAFFALRFAEAPLLRDLGTFASFSLLGASLFTLIFLPHLLKDTAKKEFHEHKKNIIDRIAALRPEKSKILLILVLVATPVLWHYAPKVRFDTDLMHLNYMSPRLEKAQNALEKDNSFALSSLFVIAQASNEDIASEKLSTITPIIDWLQKKGYIRQSLNPTTFLPSFTEQQQRIKAWNKFWTADKKDKFIRLLQAEGQKAGFSANAFEAFQETLNRDYQPYDSTAANFLKSLLPNAYGHSKGQYFAIASVKMEPGHREEVLKAFSGQDKVLATDRQMVSEKLLVSLTNDFNHIFYISGALVFLALLLAYGRLELALISFMPMALTWVWILGFMSLFGLEFNFVNVIISTLIFGLGDDYSIFMMDGLLEKYRSGNNPIQSSRSAVYLSVLTTIVGLGTLIFAQHPALKSIAFISILGLLCVVFVSQVIQPFLFNFLIQKRADKGFMPFTLWSLMKSVFSFAYFFSGCLLLTIIGLILTGIRPFGKKRSRYYFHFILSKFTKSLIYIMSNVRKHVVLSNKQVFRQPAVYIANHASFLDILVTTMLHPKLILMTNKWVWRSPVFGFIVRMADYYSVTDNLDAQLSAIRQLNADGYGIVVFPEGTRSKDGQILRFHKGAFYLAQKLELPVIPVLLHGIQNTMQKGDWLLKDGQINVFVGDARDIPMVNGATSYQQATKEAKKYFVTHLQEARDKIEQAPYFKEQLIKSYLYKGPVLEWYCRVKAKMEGYYQFFDEALPKEGKIYDLGCGNGFLSWMMYWTGEDRQITGVDYDAEKITTAAHNYRVNAYGESGKHPEFLHADLSKFTPEPCRAIVLCDVLHYLLPEVQEQLLERCISALEPGSTLIIRDGITEMVQRHEKTKLTELLSTQLLRFNKTENELHFLSRQWLANWAQRHQLQMEIKENDTVTSNLIFIFRKR